MRIQILYLTAAVVDFQRGQGDSWESLQFPSGGSTCRNRTLTDPDPAKMLGLDRCLTFLPGFVSLILEVALK